MIDLTPEEMDLVKKILKSHLPGVEVRVFGSRATGKAQPYSDLDLLLVGEDKIPRAVLSRLEDAFSESDLPFRVDLVDWHRTSPSFLAALEGKWEVLLQGDPDR